MNSREIRKKFLKFFERKGHKIIPSSSLISDNPSVLLTTAGMQQFILHLQGDRDPIKDFGTRHLASCQKCFRTDDIEEIGDDTHHTFFEMLGNWSIGEDEKGYFKEGAIKYSLEFLINELGLDKNKIWVTIFKGENKISKDEESIKIWQANGIPRQRIKEFGMKDNFWGPVWRTGPCGPNSEIYYDTEKDGCNSIDCGPNCPKCKRIIEIWNLVFMEYFKDENGNYRKLPQRNIDTGIGFERLTGILQKKSSAYETDLFLPIIIELEKLSKKEYEKEKRIFRIIADHIRGAVFLISDGVSPSNVKQGYILRRILRRIIRYKKILNLPKNFLIPLAQKIIETYHDVYPELKNKENDILTNIRIEEEKFEKTLEQGLKELNRQILNIKSQNLKIISGKVVFDLYQNFGFPLELTKEIVKEENLNDVDEASFNEEFKKHQEISRIAVAGVERKFGGGGFFSPKLHTATHLLHAALREILGKHVKQMGSDITPERLRFDFSHPQKITNEEIKKIENLVNQKIKENLEIKKQEMSYDDAIKLGALAFFKEKYPKGKISVYIIGSSTNPEQIFSKEICAGPHVDNTSELGVFKIIKEESSSAGVRRIKAILLDNKKIIE